MPFSHLLMGILFLIIVTIVLSGIWINHANSASHAKENAERLRAMTASYMDNSFRMIDTGLKLYDNTYNQEMRDAFDIVMAEYLDAKGDPSQMDLPALKDRIGGMDIHLINDQCVIAHSSSPLDVGLDFSVIYPDFCQYLRNIWNSSGYYPDRVVMEWHTGALTKYGYMPSPDHRYIIELALRSESFTGERMDLQYSDVVEEVKAFNPYLEEILLFQKQKRLLYNTSYIPTPEESEMLDYILWENRSSQVITDKDAGKTVVWQVIDLRDPDYAADMSIFAKLTFDDAMLMREIDHIGILHAFAALLVIFSGGLIAATVSRKLSRPIEKLVEDVNMIAEGDLDHSVTHSPNLELSNLSDSIQVMVNRLKAQIRQCEASEERFMELVQLLPQGVFETDLNGNITFANPTAFEVFGYSLQDFEKGINIFDILAPGYHLLAKARFGEILEEKKSQGSEYTGIRKDGSTFPIMVYSAARKDQGIVNGIRGTIVDITHLKKIEEEIRKMNAELEARVAQRTSELEFATREMEAFTYSVSHDLRGPLRAIDGFSHLLSESAVPCLDERQQHFINVIRHNVELMDSLIDGLLALSRMGRQELKREWISPEPMVREVMAEFLNQAPGRKIDVRIGSLPECYADPPMLRQVFTNLIGNAVKFTRKTENAQIEIGSLFRDEKTVYYVRDNGAGFDMKYANKLFMEFQRLHRQEEYEGSGIGLAIVERIIRRHGGEIWAESEPGHGATFYFSLGEES